jgi:hypothetical protein
MKIAWTACLTAALLALPALAQQVADPDFQPKVSRPAYSGKGPVVLVDEAHGNFHTASGRYAPFAQLLRADGFDVRPNTAKFDAGALKGARILVVANAMGPPGSNDSVFTPEECAAVKAWVQAGGSLLLIADHTPFGAAASRLAETFGVRMGKGYVFEPVPGGAPNALTTQLEYGRKDGWLADHPITRGRDAGEAVQKIRAFTGQSLTVPAGATNLMRLGPEAREAADTDALNTEAAKPPAERTSPRAGPSQGLAMKVGKGRVVITGEAAMFSAQVAQLPNPPRTVRMGMNVPGLDNQQFALNVVRWLSGALN